MKNATKNLNMARRMFGGGGRGRKLDVPWHARLHHCRNRMAEISVHFGKHELRDGKGLSHSLPACHKQGEVVGRKGRRLSIDSIKVHEKTSKRPAPQ